MLTPTEDGMMTVITPAITRADDMMMSRALCTLLKSFVIIISLFRVIDVKCPSVAERNGRGCAVNGNDKLNPQTSENY